MATNALTPKKTFQKIHKDYADQLSREVVGGWLPTTLSYVLADVALSGASTEQISGAKLFIQKFMNFGDPDVEPGQMPDKSALSTY